MIMNAAPFIAAPRELILDHYLPLFFRGLAAPLSKVIFFSNKLLKCKKLMTYWIILTSKN
jgi:hypothetical protein